MATIAIPMMMSLSEQVRWIPALGSSFGRNFRTASIGSRMSELTARNHAISGIGELNCRQKTSIPVRHRQMRKQSVISREMREDWFIVLRDKKIKKSRDVCTFTCIVTASHGVLSECEIAGAHKITYPRLYAAMRSVLTGQSPSSFWFRMMMTRLLSGDQ